MGGDAAPPPGGADDFIRKLRIAPGLFDEPRIAIVAATGPRRAHIRELVERAHPDTVSAVGFNVREYSPGSRVLDIMHRGSAPRPAPPPQYAGFK